MRSIVDSMHDRFKYAEKDPCIKRSLHNWEPGNRLSRFNHHLHTTGIKNRGKSLACVGTSSHIHLRGWARRRNVEVEDVHGQTERHAGVGYLDDWLDNI